MYCRARKILAVIFTAAVLLPEYCVAQNSYSLTNGQVLGPSQAMLELVPDAGVPRRREHRVRSTLLPRRMT